MLCSVYHNRSEPNRFHAPQVYATHPVIIETAGKAVAPTAVAAVNKGKGHTIHSVITGSGSGYQNFQARIM